MSVPGPIEEAVAAMRGGDARALAGGTDLIPQLREGRRRAGRVVDLKRIPELTAISALPDGGIAIGAAANATAVSRHAGVAASYPAVAQSACLIGGVQVQNRASLGGNICNAAPSADAVPALVCHGARAVVAGANGRRELAVEDAVQGSRQDQPRARRAARLDPAAASRSPARRPNTCASRRGARWTSPSPAPARGFASMRTAPSPKPASCWPRSGRRRCARPPPSRGSPASGPRARCSRRPAGSLPATRAPSPIRAARPTIAARSLPC